MTQTTDQKRDFRNIIRNHLVEVLQEAGFSILNSDIQSPTVGVFIHREDSTENNPKFWWVGDICIFTGVILCINRNAHRQRANKLKVPLGDPDLTQKIIGFFQSIKM